MDLIEAYPDSRFPVRPNKMEIDKAMAYERTFSTPAGEIVLKDLCEQYLFGGEIFMEDQFKSNLGQGAEMVVRSIIRKIKLGRHHPRLFPKSGDHVNEP